MLEFAHFLTFYVVFGVDEPLVVLLARLDCSGCLSEDIVVEAVLSSGFHMKL
jgi:hypothetical protein